MANVNINAGAAGNPLDALIAQNKGSLYGSSGLDIENALAQSRAGTIDPRIAAMGYHRTPYDDTYQFDPTDPNVSGATGDITLNGKPYHQLASTSIGGQGQPIDPSQVIYDPKYGLLTPQSNLKPISNGYGDMVFGLAALGLGLPTLMAATGAGAGGAAGGASSGGGSSLPDSYWGMTADGGNVATDAVPEGVGGGGSSSLDFGGYTGGIDPETAAGQGGMSVAQNGIGPGSFGDQLTGAINNPSSLLSSDGLIGNAGSSIADAVSRNPIGAIRAGIGVGSLVSGLSGGSSGASHGGASGDMNSIIEQMANANRVNQNTPIGSRQWVHNPDGTWTVNDSMSAPEQANFTNVQGMNADLTNMARQRLAQLLAQPFNFQSYYQRAGAGG